MNPVAGRDRWPYDLAVRLLPGFRTISAALSPVLGLIRYPLSPPTAAIGGADPPRAEGPPPGRMLNRDAPRIEAGPAPETMSRELRGRWRLCVSAGTE